MTALAAEATVDVCPLGRPGRYGMTPKLQATYRAMALAYAHGVTEFRHRDIVSLTGHPKTTISWHLQRLAERGWVTNTGERYYLTLPVMRFRPATEHRP